MVSKLTSEVMVHKGVNLKGLTVNPRSVMSQIGPNFKLGDQDKMINSFNKNRNFKYAMVLVRDICYESCVLIPVN